MKIHAAFILATVAVSVSAGGPKREPRFSGLEKIPDNEGLPLHQLPECYQSCYQSSNHGLVGHDANTVSRRVFCEDKWTNFDWWFETWLAGCLNQNCPSEDGDKARSWYNSICRL